LGKELKGIPKKYGNVSSGFSLTPSPSSFPTSEFSFFHINQLRKMVLFRSFVLGMFFFLSFYLGFRNPRKKERKKNIPRKNERKKTLFSTNSTGLNKESSGCPNDCIAVRRLGNWGCSKKSTKNKLANRSSDKQSESVDVRP